MEDQNKIENTNDDDTAKTEGVVVSKQKLMALRSMVANLSQASEALNDFISGLTGLEGGFTAAAMAPAAHIEKMIEGVFDGERMIGSDGKQYAIPVNYASKSKLVEGDLLKLSVTDQGTMIYKQIQPIDRLRLTGNLEQSETGEWTVMVNGKRFKILGASVTYFKGEIGDEVIILVPKTGQSRWAAVEHIFKKT